MIRVLGLETSGPLCRVAVGTWRARPLGAAAALRDGRFVERTGGDGLARHAEVLLGLVDAALRASGVRLRALDGVAVSLGPGSFTGLRVGLAAAKTFAAFGPLPLAGVPTLAAMAAEAGGAGLLWTARDAGRGEVYAARFRAGPRGPRPAGAVAILPAAALAPGARTEPPRAATVAALGAARLLGGRRDDPDRLVPLYVRRPEAEVRLRRARARR